MTKIYLIGLICAIVCGAYFFGISIGNSRCKIQNFQNQINLINQDTKQQRIINDKIYKTGAGDIRRILRDKYTIAE
jgi:hypothetical protein